MTTKYLGDGLWARRTNLDSADIMMPTERQSVYAESIQTHNAVSIGAGAWSYSSWINVEGFDKVGLNVGMTSGTGMSVEIQTSFDGVNFLSTKVISGGTNLYLSEEASINAPYIRIAINNKDASVAKTTSAWIYLKA